MTSQHFKTLSENLQYRHLLIDGVCIARRETENTHVLLFQLDEEYVEVVFTSEGDKVLGVNMFSDTEGLDPYLGSMGLPDAV